MSIIYMIFLAAGEMDIDTDEILAFNIARGCKLENRFLMCRVTQDTNNELHCLSFSRNNWMINIEGNC